MEGWPWNACLPAPILYPRETFTLASPDSPLCPQSPISQDKNSGIKSGEREEKEEGLSTPYQKESLVKTGLAPSGPKKAGPGPSPLPSRPFSLYSLLGSFLSLVGLGGRHKPG